LKGLVGNRPRGVEPGDYVFLGLARREQKFILNVLFGRAARAHSNHARTIHRRHHPIEQREPWAILFTERLSAAVPSSTATTS